MNGNYILNGRHEPVLEPDVLTWWRWFMTADRIVKKDADEGTGVEVSTVFNGWGHQFGDGPPILFETRVFGGVLHGEQDRYSTWTEAEAGHAAMVQRVRYASA